MPFCIRKCDYCDFVSFSENGMAPGYFDALRREIDLCAEENSGKKFNTIFFGGGTPSLLPPYYIARTMKQIMAAFDVTIDEATIECNPGTVDEKKLAEYKKAGFNRLSIGVQSFDDGLLKGIGRIHTAAEAGAAVEAARAAGFDNINIDLMYGLPRQTVEKYTASIEQAAELGVEHISAYSLILEEGTRLYDRMNRGETALPDEDLAYDMHRTGMEVLSKLGYSRYEISNYAKPGRECMHNLNYWNVGEYLGLGLNASSALRRGNTLVRFHNAESMGEYLADIENGRLPRREIEAVSEREEMFEWAMLGLRKIEGVDRAEFKKRFGVDFSEAFADAVAALEKTAWLEQSAGYVRLTDRGLDMQNTALMEFMEQE